MIGVSCTEFCSSPAEEWTVRIAEHFDLWEIFSEADHRVDALPDDFPGLLDRLGLRRQVHAPICDWNIAALNPCLRQASLDVTIRTILEARALGAETVTVHPGLSSMAVGGTEERAMAKAKESIRSLDRLFGKGPVRVCIENMPDVPFFLGRTAKDLFDLVDGTDLSICFDIGHANTTGQIDDIIDLLGDRISNIHIHDNHGKKDEHLTIGDGDIDFRHVIGRLSGYSGNWIIESKSLESAIESQSRLEKMLS